jgi:hypothetical protein
MFHAPMGRFLQTSTQDLKNIGKASDTQKANPNSLKMSLTMDMKLKQYNKPCP